MFAYTINPQSWQMTTTPEPQEAGNAPRAKKEYQRRHPEISLREAFRAKYPDSERIVDDLKTAIGKEPTWRLLTKANLVKFISHLEAKYAPNTANQYATRLKAVLNIYSEETKLPISFSRILSPKKVETTSVFLNESELALLEAYQPQTPRERLVRNLFICSAYTGARYADIMRMNRSNIRGSELIFIAQKTRKEARLPLKPIVERYILEMPKIEISPKVYIQVIQRICKNIGLTEPVKLLQAGRETEMPKYQAVTSHTARKSFATNLYLRGVDINTISRLLQHSDLSLTQHYICSGLRPLTETEMQYFS